MKDKVFSAQVQGHTLKGTAVEILTNLMVHNPVQIYSPDQLEEWKQEVVARLGIPQEKLQPGGNESFLYLLQEYGVVKIYE